jgi:DNA-directed RNA polymerase specialized sigma24 family protein
MSGDGSISLWLPRLKAGDGVAVQKLWEGYFQRLVALARAKLRGAPRRAEDEEDAALSAFDSFCRGAEAGRFPQLYNRDDLWRLLVMITARKAYDLAERAGRRKRGGGQVRGDSALLDAAAGDAHRGWEEVAGDEPSPEFAAQAVEEYRRLLGQLDDDGLRSIAVWKMEGLTNREIADRLGCAVPTVERRLRLIRKTWAAEVGGTEPPSTDFPPR